MPSWLCATCGVQQDDTPHAPDTCPICSDERQYVPESGQRWTTLEELRRAGHRSEARLLEADLLGVGVQPRVAIGQRTLVVRTAQGALLWDPGGYVDDDAVDAVRRFCTVTAIAPSHPHFYGVMPEWSRRLGGVPVLVPEADVQWMQVHDVPVQTWSHRLEVLPGVTLLQCGGHFAGSAVVHWSAGADGRGALLTGDSISVVADRRYVSFMRSFPNEIPLGPRHIQRILDAIRPLRFERIYGGWWDSVIDHDAKASVERSAERYIRWATGATDE